MIRGVVSGMDPELTLFNAGSLRDGLALALFPARVATVALGVFGLLAVALAATGLFGMMAYSVSRRSREIGIRMALGAQAGQVLMLVFRRALILCSIGICIGVAATFAAGPLLGSLLYGISPRDPVAYSLALAAMVGVCLLACLSPARRAIRIDPVRSLREE